MAEVEHLRVCRMADNGRDSAATVRTDQPRAERAVEVKLHSPIVPAATLRVTRVDGGEQLAGCPSGAVPLKVLEHPDLSPAEG